jgi:hypothetical protein
MMKGLRAVPEIAADARDSIDNLNGGISRANTTMTILASVALVALGVAVVALLRATAVARAGA